jgi:uncharacterized membrane protein YphA (DoxX/SURF4 family)
VSFDVHGLPGMARLSVGLVWVVFGLCFKVLRLLPRHEQIVARILGPRVAPVLTRLIGVAETGMGVWMLSGYFAPWCAACQTVVVITMNSIELVKARDLLLAPVPMLLGNTVLLSLAWYAALAHG